MLKDNFFLFFNTREMISSNKHKPIKASFGEVICLVFYERELMGLVSTKKIGVCQIFEINNNFFDDQRPVIQVQITTFFKPLGFFISRLVQNVNLK